MMMVTWPWWGVACIVSANAVTWPRQQEWHGCEQWWRVMCGDAATNDGGSDKRWAMAAVMQMAVVMTRWWYCRGNKLQ
jgi:hypothetical protein